MTALSIGDLALNLQQRLGQTRVKSEIVRLSQELTTGQVRDTGAALAGELGALSGIERALTTLDAYEVAAGEAALFTGAASAAIETLQDTGAEIGPALLRAGTTGEATLVAAAAADGRARLGTVIATLNTRIADRAIFAGTATDGAALAGRDAILAALSSATAGETTASGLAAAVDAWFDTPGGGFETVAYLGADTALAPFRVGAGHSATLTLRADDAGLRDLMKGYVLAALAAEGALSGDAQERAALLHDAGLRIMAGDAMLAGLGAETGLAEASIEEARSANAAEASALGIARAEMTGVDPYATASALRAAETQLETLYALTARLSRLSLAEYLR